MSPLSSRCKDQFFVWTEALPFSGALFLPTRSSFFSSALSSLSHSASLQSYAHDDISVGSWMMGLNATYVDDDRLCCSSSRQGTSFSLIKTMHQLLAVPRKLPCFFFIWGANAMFFNHHSQRKSVLMLELSGRRGCWPVAAHPSWWRFCTSVILYT